MRVVGIKELKNRLSEYVKLAAGGEVVLVADRDRVVAELVPPREERAPMVADAMLADLVRQGLLTPAMLPVGLVPPRPVVPPGTVLPSLEELLSGLDWSREDRA